MTAVTAHRAIVLFAHGSRDPLWHRPMEAVASHIRLQAPEVEVACAYLELSQPDLPSTVAKLAAQHITQVTVVPMFLGVGRHAREDLPALVAQLRQDYPAIHFYLQPAVGEDPRLITMLSDIARSPVF